MTSKTQDELASEAFMLMEQVDHDSFGPVDAVRALVEYNAMSAVERWVVLAKLRNLIGAQPGMEYAGFVARRVLSTHLARECPGRGLTGAGFVYPGGFILQRIEPAYRLHAPDDCVPVAEGDIEDLQLIAHDLWQRAEAQGGT